MGNRETTSSPGWTTSLPFSGTSWRSATRNEVSEATVTARAASQSFSSYGMTAAETRDEKDDSDEDGSRSGFGMIADVGTIDANGIKGQVYSLPLYARFKLSKRGGLNFDIPLNGFPQISAPPLRSTALRATNPSPQ